MIGIGIAVGLAGCPAEPPPECIAVDLACAPGYPPTFANVYKNTLAVSCGATQSSCHSASGHMGGLVMTDAPTAYANLMAPSQHNPSRNRVVPGDAACSSVVVRTGSPGKDYQMPPGDALSPQERCAVALWVAMGAQP